MDPRDASMRLHEPTPAELGCFHFINDCHVADRTGVAVIEKGAPLMRFFKTSRPLSAEDEVAVARLQELAMRARTVPETEPDLTEEQQEALTRPDRPAGRKSFQ